MKNFIQPGNTLTALAPNGGVVSGQGVMVNDTFMVVAADAAEGTPFDGVTAGVVTLPKATGGGSGFEFGEVVRWNIDLGVCSNAPALPAIGTCANELGVSTSAAAVNVRLVPSPLAAVVLAQAEAIATLQGEIEDLDSALSALDARVTALEE